MKRIKIIIITSIVAFTCVVIPLACKKSFLNQTNTFGLLCRCCCQYEGECDWRWLMVFMIHTRIVTCLKNVSGTGLISERMTFLTGVLMYSGITTRSPLTFVGLITFWNQSYIGIARANSASCGYHKAEENGVVDAALADRLSGEAYFLRGNDLLLSGCFFWRRSS